MRQGAIRRKQSDGESNQTGTHDFLTTARWKSALGQIDPANPPIAGLDGVPLADGVTTQNLYFTRIFVSGTWQSNRLSQTMTRLDGTSAVVSMREPLLKLAEPTSSGGADLEFRPSSSAYGLAKASVTIRPDEKTMQFSITDGMGRSVMSGTMTGPAADTPNQLITWNCTQHDQVYNLTGFGDVTRVNSIDRDGNINASLSDGFGQGVGSLDADDNLSRRKYDETGSMRETIDANNVAMSYTYDDMGRQVTTTTASGTTETIYDPATGRVDSRKDAKGNSCLLYTSPSPRD